MIALLAKTLDWSAIQAVTLMIPAEADNPRLEEALEFLKRPGFVPADNQPAQVQFNRPLDFHFPTPRPCDFSENNVVHGRFYRCGERWRERPVVILLHGSGDSLNYNFRFPLTARRCNRAGFNAAALVAPYHFQRRPRKLGGSLFYSDCVQFAEAMAQAIVEVRALTGWLLREGCPAVALWGISLGANSAGMTVCRDSRLAAVVMNSPLPRMIPWLAERAVRPSIRRKLPIQRKHCAGLNQTPMNLTTIKPAISRKNILLIEGIYDLMSPRDAIEDLWQTWGQPDIWRLPHGHVGVCCGLVPGLPGRVLRWLAPRLDNPIFMTLSNERSALDARTTRCLHVNAQWPGASESER
jgi:pimeloyl-ACP methyl ester carboxylesterase